MWFFQCVLKHCTIVICACALPERLISRFSAIWKSFCPLCGTIVYTYRQEIQRDAALKNSTRMHCNMALVQSTCEFCKFTKRNCYTHTDCSIPPSIERRNVLFKLKFSSFFKAEGSNSIRQDFARFLFSYKEQLQIAQQVKRQLSYFSTVD